jgi:hypothetical protein
MQNQFLAKRKKMNDAALITALKGLFNKNEIKKML